MARRTKSNGTQLASTAPSPRDNMDWVPDDIRSNKEALRAMMELYVHALSVHKTLTSLDKQQILTYGYNKLRQSELRELSHAAKKRKDSRLYLALSRQMEQAVATSRFLIRDLRLERTPQGHLRRAKSGGGTGEGEQQDWKGLL